MSSHKNTLTATQPPHLYHLVLVTPAQYVKLAEDDAPPLSPSPITENSTPVYGVDLVVL